MLSPPISNRIKSFLETFLEAFLVADGDVSSIESTSINLENFDITLFSGD